MVFQSYALYPHMTVAENIGFTLRMVGTPRGRDRARGARGGRARQDRRICSTAGPASSRAASSSAARSRARSCASPGCSCSTSRSSNLDAKLRLETRVELKKLQRALDVTTIYVTHDQEEAMTIADRMAIFIDGRLMQVGTPEEVFERPANVEVATFLGSPPMNLVQGELDGRTLAVDGHRLELPHDHAGGPGP